MPIGLQQLTVYAGDEGLGTNVSYGVGASGEAVITSNITLDRGLYSDVVDPLGKVQSLYHRIIPRVLSSLFVTSIAHVLQNIVAFLTTYLHRSHDSHSAENTEYYTSRIAVFPKVTNRKRIDKLVFDPVSKHKAPTIFIPATRTLLLKTVLHR